MMPQIGTRLRKIKRYQTREVSRHRCLVESAKESKEFVQNDFFSILRLLYQTEDGLATNSITRRIITD